ncbi:tetratricopeptide repeat protein [Legionella micdadei]|nr:tetratricopeptide repeat protein [Legionella micdadei]KTD26661.1 tetratricopeptide repeat protein [Legionella micdadei]NSL19466.1 tetratricopeptide repeat protein [Legionella micdadei]SCY47937.1 Tetratricopeptide repeat-containing protein [Legionella micdadei]
MDNIKERLNRYLQFLEQDPSNVNLLLSISESYRQLNDFNEAQRYLDKAKTIDANACIALEGILALNQGHFERAKKALFQAVSSEDLPILRYNLAVCHYSLNEPDEGIAALTPLFKQNPSYEIEFLMAQLLQQQGQLEQAINLLKFVLEQHGSSEKTLVLLAQLYLDNHDEIAAANTAQQVLIINQKNYEAQVILLLLRLVKEEVTVNEIEIKKLLAEHATDSRLWFALGTTYFRAIRLQDAEKAYLKAAKLNPQFYDNWVSLGWCQLFLDKLDEAQHCYQQAIALNEGNSEGWGGLALIHALRSNLDDAADLITKAAALDSECFLAKIAQIIHLSHANPGKAEVQFKETFPQIVEQINAAMATVLQEVDKNKTVH